MEIPGKQVALNGWCPGRDSVFGGYGCPCRSGAKTSALNIMAQAQGAFLIPEPGPVDLKIGHDFLDIVSRFLDMNQFDPVDRVDIGRTRIAVFPDPVARPAGAGIVSGKSQYIGAAEFVLAVAYIGTGQGCVKGRIIRQPPLEAMP